MDSSQSQISKQVSRCERTKFMKFMKPFLEKPRLVVIRELWQATLQVHVMCIMHMLILRWPELNCVSGSGREQGSCVSIVLCAHLPEVHENHMRVKLVLIAVAAIRSRHIGGALYY